MGKDFENDFKKSCPDNIWIERYPDAAQSFGNQANSVLRFSRKSPCDYFMFNGETSTFYALELKSVASNSISFERVKEDKGVIHKHQIDYLEKFATYKNHVGGFLLDFRDSDITYFLEIEEFIYMIGQIDKKSFNEKDLAKYCSPTIIDKRKLKVHYRYNIEKFLNDTKLN